MFSLPSVGACHHTPAIVLVERERMRTFSSDPATQADSNRLRQVGRWRRTDFLEVGECEVEIAVQVFVARGRDNEAFDATVRLQSQSNRARCAYNFSRNSRISCSVKVRASGSPSAAKSKHKQWIRSLDRASNLFICKIS